MLFTEDRLSSFSKAISCTEDKTYQTTISMIESVLSDLDYRVSSENDMGNPPKSVLRFSKSNGDRVTLLVQGSYANDTCVKQDSDVDIAVIYENTFKVKYPEGATDKDYGYSVSAFDQKSFKDEVFEKLKEKYSSSVDRSNGKSLKVKGNTSRKDCDVVPCMRFRDHKSCGSKSADRFCSGISILTDDGEVIVNYPEVHYENEVRKNDDTQKRYKKIVRIFKCIANEFELSGKRPKSVSSFKIECSLYNVPDDVFLKNYQSENFYSELANGVCEYILSSDLSEYLESNEIKKLFSSEDEINEMTTFINDLVEAIPNVR